MLLQLGFIELTIEQWALLGWIIGAVYSAFLIFYGKVRAGKLTMADFNFGFIVNFILNLIIGVAASLLIFSTWTIPTETWWVVAIFSFGAAAGIDQEGIKTILDKIGLYVKVAEIFGLDWSS